jgi:tetratricopeptide (TPR) repeat protein
MNNLAGAYQAAGRLPDALSLFEESLRLFKAKLGPDHPLTITSVNNLAGGYDVAGQMDKALPLYEEALRLRRARLGPEHPQTLNSIHNLALAYRDIEDYVRAEPLLVQLLELQTKKLGPDRPEVAATLANLGVCLLRQKKHAEAEVRLRASLTIRIPAQPEAWTTSNVKSLLGASLLGQHRHAEAEPLLLDGYRELVQREAAIPPQHKIRVVEAGERIVRLYVDWGRNDRAEEWRRQLDETKAGAKAKP